MIKHIELMKQMEPGQAWLADRVKQIQLSVAAISVSDQCLFNPVI